mgnify:CR=1 FL=1
MDAGRVGRWFDTREHPRFLMDAERMGRRFVTLEPGVGRAGNAGRESGIAVRGSDSSENQERPAAIPDDGSSLEARVREWVSVVYYQMVRSMRATVHGDSYFSAGLSEDIFTQMQDQSFAQALADRTRADFVESLVEDLSNGTGKVKVQNPADDWSRLRDSGMLHALQGARS